MEIDTGRLRVSFLDEGKGMPVVLLHPFSFTSRAFAADAAALSSKMRVVVPDMRGIGATTAFDARVAPSVDAMADDVASLLDALGIAEKAVVGGISMGGYVALAFARRHASRLRGLVLADTRAEADSDEARANRDKNMARVRSGDYEGFVDDFLAALIGKDTLASRPDVRRQARALALETPPEAVVALLGALRDRPDARPDLAAIDVPALVIVGEQDTVTPPSAAETLANGIRQSTLRVISGSGHLVNLEAPDVYREAVARFVTTLERSR